MQINLHGIPVAGVENVHPEESQGRAETSNREGEKRGQTEAAEGRIAKHPTNQSDRTRVAEKAEGVPGKIFKLYDSSEIFFTKA